MSINIEVTDYEVPPLPPELMRQAINRLREDPNFTIESRELVELYEENRTGWYIPFHFSWGVSVRNWLRESISDDMLPTGNWDDYYVEVIECAIGVRKPQP